MNAVLAVALDVAWWVTLVFLGVQGLVAIVNAVSFPRLDTLTRRVARDPSTGPQGVAAHAVSILVPARNEAATLPSTLPLLLQQGAREVLVLDDGSTDETAAIVDALAQDHPTLRRIEGQTLPEGWGGKNWACHQLAAQAQGDLWVFTDADVAWNEGALDALLKLQGRNAAGLTTVWPRQATVGWVERIAVPQIDMILLGALPHPLVDALPFASLAAANGQVMAWTPDAYARVDGHASVADEVLEDVRLAQRAKRLGVRLALALGGARIEARMYRSTRDVIDGFAKNVGAAAGSPAALALLVLVNLLAYTAVWPLALYDARFVWLAALGVALRALIAATSGRTPLEGLWQPLAPFLVLIVAARAASWRGGYAWRGRHYAPKGTP